MDTGLSLFLKFTTQGFLNNTASESRAFIRAGKHNFNGQAENGWIKLFFPLSLMVVILKRLKVG